MYLIKSVFIGSCLMCIQLTSFATSNHNKYTPKDIFVSYSQDNYIINQGNSQVKLPKVNIETKEREWNTLTNPYIFFAKDQISKKDLKQLLTLSDRFGFKLDSAYLNLFSEVNSWLGTKYRYASQSEKGIDCSGFTNMLYQRVYNKSIDRSSSSQASQLTKVVAKDKLQPGNLVFFATNRRNKKRISHVGIYLGSGYFAHASTHSGVIISELRENYYATRYVTGGEI